MKQVGAFLFGLAGAVVALFLYNGATTGDFSPSNYSQWLLSLFSGTAAGIGGTVDAITGGGDALSIATGLIQSQEGFRAKAYTDETGNLTIGYGHKIVESDPYDASSEITNSQALDLLSSDVSIFLNCVESAISQPMTAQQEGAMISLCYNIGCDNFSNSTLVSLFNSGDAAGAANEFLKWNKGHVSGILTVIAGLTARRSVEQSVFLAGSTDLGLADTSA